MSSPIGVAIIGSGIFVREQHLPAVLACPDLTLKALYSRSLTTAQSLLSSLPTDHQQLPLYSSDSPSNQDYAALLARSDIHAVIIALPIPIQPTFIKQALQAGKHVLAEKPLAKDVATALELLTWYRNDAAARGLNFSVAEQFRFYAAYAHAAENVKELGRVVGVKVRMHACVKPGMKYLETAWRKTPEYQGGFLLDGGVHFVAGLRVLLRGGGVRVKKVVAFTSLLKEYLPPVDTVDAVLLLDNGATGTFGVSFGTTFTGAEWSVACEGGTVSVDRTVVRTKVVGEEEEVVVDVKDEVGGSEGVKEEHVPVGSVIPEVYAWARGLREGKWDARQSAEEGLADLEMLEAFVVSGERGGEAVELKYQV